MFSIKQPYIIIPKLIEQPTWGGDYILGLKNWLSQDSLQEKKIGQSYELYGKSKLALHITDTTDNNFIPEVGFADKIDTQDFSLFHGKDFINLNELWEQNGEQVLGKKVLEKYGSMPLLIKINQAFGNSFQLHIKPSVSHPRWKSKPEAWYYLEDGLITCGIHDGIDLNEYKKTCEAIEGKMSQLSAFVQSGYRHLEDAKQEAKEYIKRANPWQFVNTYPVKKYELIDTSMGGIHHSWEEDKEKFPLGNVTYEVQLDVMDPVSTIRCFDQGKFKADGGIREIHIDDYFMFLDDSPDNNNIENLRKKSYDNRLLNTPYYYLDIIEVTDRLSDKTGDSFCHLYVRDGDIEVITAEKTIRLTKGHSCFLPQAVEEYEIKANIPQSVILKTYVEV